MEWFDLDRHEKLLFYKLYCQQIEKKEIPSKVQELQNNINLIPMNKIQRVPTTKVKDTPGSQTEEGRS